MNAETTQQEILNLLSDKDLKTQLEILANVFIVLGARGIRVPGSEYLSKDNIVDIALKDKRENGETIHNALVFQGLTLHLWLENMN